MRHLSVNTLRRWGKAGPWWALVLATLWLAVPAAVDEEAARRAEDLRRKLALIARRGEVRAKGPYATAITEEEVNAYLQQYGASLVPAGVVNPRVTILEGGRLAGVALIDLDVVRQSRPRGLIDPIGYLTGRVPVQATGVLRTGNGIGRFEIEAAQVAGLPVPKVVLQELIAHYTRTTDRPEGVNLEAPFALPAGIREIRVAKGRAVVVQ